MTKQEFLNIVNNVKTRALSLLYKIDEYNINKDGPDKLTTNEDKVKWSLTLYKLFKDEMINLDQTILDEMTIGDYKSIGCKFWDDDLLLFPDWLLSIIPNGTEVYSISGDSRIIGHADDMDMDMDTRLGVSAYGFNKTQIRKAKLNEVLEK